ncbi:MAG: hypothetical protein ACI8T1_004470 [Verrucomicrobiales bacterium]
MTLSERGFSRIIIADDSRRGDRIRVDFNASDREHISRRNRYRGTDSEVHGQGTIRTRGRTKRLTQASVAHYENGNATLTLQADGQHVVEGTWFGCQHTNALELEIDRLNDRPAEGTGKLILHDNREVHAIEIDGRSDANKGTFKIDCRPAGHEDERSLDRRNGRRDDPILRDQQRHVRHSINTIERAIGRYESRASNAIVNQAKIQLGANGEPPSPSMDATLTVSLAPGHLCAKASPKSISQASIDGFYPHQNGITVRLKASKQGV